MTDDWCILRTGGQRTVLLVRSLAKAGLDAWTPTRIHLRPKTRRKPAEEREVAILPTFVFAQARHLPELERCLRLPANPHPAFSIFRYYGDTPIIADRLIAGLREAEADAAKATDARRKADAGRSIRDARDAVRRMLPAGHEVTIPAGAFIGMTGVVESSTRKEAWVNFGGGFRMKIDTWLLAQDQVQAA